MSDQTKYGHAGLEDEFGNETGIFETLNCMRWQYGPAREELIS